MVDIVTLRRELVTVLLASLEQTVGKLAQSITMGRTAPYSVPVVKDVVIQ